MPGNDRFAGAQPLALTLTCALACFASHARAATYAVGPTRPHATLNALFAAVDLGPGDVVEVDGDVTYAGGIVVPQADGGAAGNPVILRGLRVNGQRPRLVGGTNTIEFRLSDHLVFEGFEVIGSQADNTFRCVYHHAHDIVIRDAYIHDCPRHGILGADNDSGSLTVEYTEIAAATMAYTASGQRSTSINGSGTDREFYDERSRLVRMIDVQNREITYTYDAAGNMLTRKSPTALHTYTYDVLNRLASVIIAVTGEPTRTVTYRYDAVGNRTEMTSQDGTKTKYAYDRLNRLISLAKRSATAALLFSATYTVDASGMRIAIDESDAIGRTRTVAYAYDANDRLQTEVAGTVTTTYAYDDNATRSASRHRAC